MRGQGAESTAWESSISVTATTRYRLKDTYARTRDVASRDDREQNPLRGKAISVSEMATTRCRLEEARDARTCESRVVTTENKTHCVGKTTRSAEGRQHGVARRTRRSANMGVTNSDDRETENPLRGKANSVSRDGDNGVAQRKRTVSDVRSPGGCAVCADSRSLE